MSNLDFLDPIIWTKRTEGFVQQTENLLISGNRVLLQELPDKLQKVNINYNVPAYSASSTYALHDIVSYSGLHYRCTTAITTPEAWTVGHWAIMPNGTLMTEISSGVPDEGQFLVSYITGIIVFNVYDNAKSVNCVYFGTGRFRIPSSMIYTENTGDLVEETLEEMIDNYNLHTEDERIANEAIRESNEDTRIDNESARVIAEGLRDNAEQARVNAENARISGGALIKTGGIMTGDITISTDKGIIFGNLKIKNNTSLGTIDIESI